MRLHLLLVAASGLVLTMPALAQDSPQQQGSPDPPAARRALDGVPLVSPEMMEELARRVRRMQQTQEEISNPTVARPLNRLVTVPLRPGDPSQIINVVRGYPTSITFTDNTGQPWPIHWEMAGNANQPGSTDCRNSDAQLANAGGGAAIPAAVFSSGFDVCAPVKGGSTLMISSRGTAPRGGLTVMLEGAPMPIPFQLIGTADSYDSVVTVKIGQRGPNAKMELFTNARGGPVTGDVDLMAILDGTPPPAARPLLVSGAPPDGVQAWSLGGRIYLRTTATILSPQPTGRTRTAGDLYAYEIPSTPIVLASANGHTFSLSLTSQER